MSLENGYYKYAINTKLNIITASKIIDQGLLIVSTNHKIVEKKETKRLIKTLDECNKIYQAFEVMKFVSGAYNGNDIEDEAMMIQLLNKQIYNKLILLYMYYISHYHIELFANLFEDDDTLSEHQKIEKTAEYNITKIINNLGEVEL